MNIGELFVSLGFDVDSGKLKDFNDKIIAGRNELLKISAVATGAVYALNAFAENSVNNAVAIRNLTNEVGANGEAVSKWQALVRATNPAMGAEEALASYKHLSDYLRDASLGKGAGALNMLGVNYFNGMTNEQAIAQIKAALPGAEQRFTKAQISGFLNDVMGTAGVLNALRTSDEDAERLTAGRFRTQAQLDELAKLGDKLNDVNIQWENFKSRMTVQWAEPAITEIDKIQKKLQQFVPVIGEVLGAMNAWEKVGAAILTYYSVTWLASMLGVIAKVAGGLLGIASAGIGAGAAGLGVGLSIPYYLDKYTHWGQAFADIVYPVNTPDKMRPGSVESIMHDVGSSKNYDGSDRDSKAAPSITTNVTQHINSTASPKEVAGEAVKMIEDKQQQDRSGIYIQLDQGPSH